MTKRGARQWAKIFRAWFDADPDEAGAHVEAVVIVGIEPHVIVHRSRGHSRMSIRSDSLARSVLAVYADERRARWEAEEPSS